MVADARKAGAAALICTEKDVFNLRDVSFGDMPVGFVRIVMHVRDADSFWNVVLAKMKNHHEKAVK